MRICQTPTPASRRRTVMLLMANAIDCDAFSLWCQSRLDCHAIECDTKLEAGLERCRRVRPRLLA